MSTWERLARLPVEIEDYELEALSARVSSAFERSSTVVHLHGAGAEGLGEDVTYDALDHEIAQRAFASGEMRLPLEGSFTPSRLGGLRNLLDAFDYCAQRGIGNYGGGQFELGVGRGQIQYLASLFHGDAPNDVAPSGFNLPEPPAGLPESPLPPASSAIGFRWGLPSSS